MGQHWSDESVALAVDTYLALLSEQVQEAPISTSRLVALGAELGRSSTAVEGKFVEISQALRSLELTPLTTHAASLDKGTRPVAFNVVEEVRSRRSRGELDWVPELPEDQRIVPDDDDEDEKWFDQS